MEGVPYLETCIGRSCVISGPWHIRLVREGGGWYLKVYRWSTTVYLPVRRGYRLGCQVAYTPSGGWAIRLFLYDRHRYGSEFPGADAEGVEFLHEFPMILLTTGVDSMLRELVELHHRVSDAFDATQSDEDALLVLAQIMDSPCWRIS